ncbi:MAG: ribonuclease HI family protein [Terriglobales bacterium]
MSSSGHHRLILHVDGGSRGNPGPAGYGVVACDAAGAVLERLQAAVGVQTNNFAEYSGLIAGLRYALERGAAEVTVYADSELMVRQMQGRYAVKSANLMPLFEQASELARRLPRFRIEHVRRERNREADRLANLAMDLAGGEARR